MCEVSGSVSIKQDPFLHSSGVPADDSKTQVAAVNHRTLGSSCRASKSIQYLFNHKCNCANNALPLVRLSVEVYSRVKLDCVCVFFSAALDILSAILLPCLKPQTVHLGQSEGGSTGECELLAREESVSGLIQEGNTSPPQLTPSSN